MDAESKRRNPGEMVEKVKQDVMLVTASASGTTSGMTLMNHMNLSAPALNLAPVWKQNAKLTADTSYEQGHHSFASDFSAFLVGGGTSH